MANIPIIGGKKPLIGEVPLHVQRMLEEGNQLGQRLAALNLLIDGDYFTRLDPLDQQLLKLQESNMAAYLRVLTMRVERTQPQTQANTPSVGSLDKH